MTRRAKPRRPQRFVVSDDQPPSDFYGDEIANGTRRDLPKPPPAALGFDPVKWRTMSRAERRAVLRHANNLHK